MATKRMLHYCEPGDRPLEELDMVQRFFSDRGYRCEVHYDPARHVVVAVVSATTREGLDGACVRWHGFRERRRRREMADSLLLLCLAFAVMLEIAVAIAAVGGR